MPCTKCSADFNILTWKMRCTECEDMYCSKCVKKQEGHYFCVVCLILIKRPPSREQLMELKSKDLQQYLNKHKVSTHGLVEKTELVELFCRISIPVRHKRSNKKFPINIGGSVPDLAAQSQQFLNNLRSNAEAAFQGSRTMWPPNQSYSATASPTRPHIPPTRGQHNHPYPQNGRNTQNVNRTSSNNIPSATSRPQPQRQSQGPSASVPPQDYNPPKKLLKLSDFTSEEQLNDLSVKQLKELLTLNRVDYKGCVEKGELLERVVMLWVDNNLHKNDNFDGNMEDCCKICMDAPLDCVLLECGHMATCLECGKQLAECPICRQYVTRVVRTFKA